MTFREEVSERACQCAEYGVLSQQAVHQEQDTGTNADNRKIAEPLCRYGGST